MNEEPLGMWIYSVVFLILTVAMFGFWCWNQMPDNHLVFIPIPLLLSLLFFIMGRRYMREYKEIQKAEDYRKEAEHCRRTFDIY